MTIDHIRMLVPERLMSVRVTMTIRRFRDVSMAMIFLLRRMMPIVVSVTVIVHDRIMRMFNLHGIRPRIDAPCNECGGARNHAKQQKSVCQTVRRTCIPGQEITTQPAKMRQRKVGGKKCRAVTFMAGTPH